MKIHKSMLYRNGLILIRVNKRNKMKVKVMADEREQNEEQIEELYLTRGALLVCECGSHPRRLQLLTDHGMIIHLEDEYEFLHPIADSCDCVFGEDENIGYFGICYSEACKGEETVVLKKYTSPNEKPSEETIEGPKCCAILDTMWSNVKEDVYTKDQETGKLIVVTKDTEKSNIMGAKNLVTTNSFVYCKKGGARIIPYTSGLEYKGEQDIK